MLKKTVLTHANILTRFDFYLCFFIQNQLVNWLVKINIITININKD